MRRRRLCAVAAAIGALALAAAAPLPERPGFSEAEKATIRSLSLASLPPLPPDPTNRFADDPVVAALGATMFFDRRLSRTGTVSCASCHKSERQFQDDLPRAVGIGATSRRTLPLAGVAWNRFFFWDGRRDSLWAQALVPLENPPEQGMSRVALVRAVAATLRDRYEHAFGPLPDLSGLPASAGPFGTAGERRAWLQLDQAQRDAVDGVFANLGKAFAAFERSIVPGETRFDRFAAAVAAGREPAAGSAFSDQEVWGLKLFIGKAGCVRCHSGPRFSDGDFHNTGVPAVEGLPPDLGRADGLAQLLADPFNCFGKFRDGDSGACAALIGVADGHQPPAHAYKTPSLRGAAERPPYMHAGQFATLEAVLDHYARAPKAADGISEVAPLDLSAQERAALIAFLRTLQ